MGNWIYTDITIGGTVSADVAKELRALIEAEFDGENSGEIVGGHLFACGQRNYGNADEVEDFCVQHGLPYVLTWEDGGDFGPGGHAWRPGMEKAFPFDGKDGPGISLVELKRDADAGKTLAEIIEALSIGDASTLPPYVEEAGGDDADAIPPQVEEAPASPPSVADVLARAEAFVAGFEDDETQEGIPELLRDLRAAQGKEG